MELFHLHAKDFRYVNDTLEFEWLFILEPDLSPITELLKFWQIYSKNCFEKKKEKHNQ